MSWHAEECPNCGRVRVIRDASYFDGVCEKCEWDAIAGDYASVTRPLLYVGAWRRASRHAEHARRGEPEPGPFAGYC